MSEASMYKYIFKYIMIGDSEVGKTSLLHTYTDDSFSTMGPITSTIGVDLGHQLINSGVNEWIKIRIWDTAGQERFRSIISTYFRDSIGVVLVYDITNRDSFLSLNQWLDDIKTQPLSGLNRFYLLGNKLDLAETRRHVTYEEAQKWAQEHGMKYHEVTTKDKSSISNAFRELTIDLNHELSQLSSQEINELSGVAVMNKPRVTQYSNGKWRCNII